MKRKNNTLRTRPRKTFPQKSVHRFTVVKIISTVLAIVFVVKVLPLLIPKAASDKIVQLITRVTPTLAPATPEEIKKALFPDTLDLGVSFGDRIVKMIDGGAIDKDKFLALYKSRGGLSPEEEMLLDSPSNQQIIVTEQNAGFILNLLWPLGISNKTNVLTKGPMGTEYNKDVGNFASTGGWTIGKVKGGQLYNSLPLILLTEKQEETVTAVAQNIYRPCCNNSTYFPDCNHGAAMLGFIELAIAAGISEEEMYKKALILNSYWFPTTYADLYVYFTRKRGIPWNRVEPKEVLGKDFSSGSGYKKISKQLQEEGLLPKVQGGGGCGV